MDEEREEYVEHSPPIRIYEALRTLPLFDELYLGMQAMNIDLVDGFLVDWESRLLSEYMGTERTPIPTMKFVSAISELWIFGLYELLRTWRQRAQEVLDFAETLRDLRGAEREERIQQQKSRIEKASESTEGAESVYWRPFEKAAADDHFAETLQKAVDRSERVYRRLEALRVTLAKHEVPKSKRAFALAPGYGRIDMTNGSITWIIALGGKEVDVVSRQTIANACRDLAVDRPLAILPKKMQRKMKAFSKHDYYGTNVTVILEDGTEYPKVHVAWNKEVTFVVGHEAIPFDPTKVVDVRPDCT